MGLITKAINKVENEESPPAQQKVEPRPKRKKKLLATAAALVLMGICLGLGYLFLLQHTEEVPPEIARRSMSVKRRLPKPSSRQADDKMVAEVTGKEETKKKNAPGETSSGTVSRKQPIRKPAPVGVSETPQSEPNDKSPEQTHESQTVATQETRESFGPQVAVPEVPDETWEIAESPMHEPEQPEESAAAEREADLSAPEPPAEDTYGASRDLTGETAPNLPDEARFQESSLTFLEETEREWNRKRVAVTQRSYSRAGRYYKKGISYHQQGKFDQAIQSYKEALTFNPDHLQAQINLATAYLQTGRFKEAEQELVYLYALKPTDPKVLFNFGLLLYRIGEPASAEVKLKRLLELEPLHLEANLLLASIYEEKGEVDQALELCIKAYQVNSANPRVLYRLGRAWDVAEEPAKATRYYQLFLKTRSPKENRLEQAVRDRLNYLTSGKE